MKVVKWIAIALAAYVGLVVAFESLIGFFQPTTDQTLVITTTGEDGSTHDRVLARLQSGGELYVAANHWPRAWYEQALANPEVKITLDATPQAYRAVPIYGDEAERVNRDNPLGSGFRFLTGYPPRLFLRLEPLEPIGPESEL
jgi:F420H(2)-dependent quinone reductase